MLTGNTLALAVQIIGLIMQLLSGATQLIPVIEGAWTTLKTAFEGGHDITDAQLDEIKAHAASAHASVQN